MNIEYPEHVEICYNSILQGSKLDAAILTKKYTPTFKRKPNIDHKNIKEHLYSKELYIEENRECDFIMYKYYFVALTVALRRSINLESTRKLFLGLWKDYRRELTKELSLRWLVSAADSLVDHGESDVQKSIAMMAVGVANTIKLIETERRLYDTIPSFNYKKIVDACLVSQAPIFDQVSLFNPKSGDLMPNMWRRFNKITKLDAISGGILEEILKRLTVFDTTYKRFLDIKSVLNR